MFIAFVKYQISTLKVSYALIVVGISFVNEHNNFNRHPYLCGAIFFKEANLRWHSSVWQ